MKSTEELSLVSEIKDQVENALEVKKQEIAVVMKNENAIEEEKNELNAIEAEEDSEETASEEEEEEEGEEEGEEEEEEDALVEEEGVKNGIGEESAIEEEENKENAEEENNEKKIEVDSKKNTRKRRRSRKKKVALRGPATVTAKGKEIVLAEVEGEENGIGGEENEKIAEEENNEEKIEVGSKKNNKKRRRNRKKEVAQRGPETVTAEGKDKPESSGRKKASKKAEGMGMIFMCSSKTKKDCYHYKVLGLPASKREMVQKVYTGMRLFLFDFDLRLMYGIYKAAGPGGYNIEPKAFKSAFPSQVRFKVMEDCLPLAEEKFKKVIKDNYYAKNKFDCQLTSEQVKNLCKLFHAASKGSKSKGPGGSLREETRTFVDRGINRKRALDEGRRSALMGGRRYHERPVIFERGAFASPVAPLARVAPLPPPAPAPSYTYGRTLDAYGWDPLFQHHDRQLLDLESRRREEFERRDPYTSYREPPPYGDPLYSANLPPGYSRTAGLTSDYHTAAGLPPDYNHHHPYYRY